MSESRAETLVDAGQYREAAEWLDLKPRLGQFERILRAGVELEIGDSGLARNQAESLLREHLDKPARAYCMDILGRALRPTGPDNAGP